MTADQVIAAAIGAAFGGAFGALFAYFGGWFQSVLDRRRKRLALASLLLAELRAADVTLRGVYDSPNGLLPTNTFGAFALVQDALAAFEPSTVRAVVDFSAYLNAVRELSNQSVSAKLDPRLVAWAMRTQAYAGIVRVQSVKSALEKEGGRIEPFRPLNIPEGLTNPGSPALPPLPPSAFANTSAPKATAIGSARAQENSGLHDK